MSGHLGALADVAFNMTALACPSSVSIDTVRTAVTVLPKQRSYYIDMTRGTLTGALEFGRNKAYALSKTSLTRVNLAKAYGLVLCCLVQRHVVLEFSALPQTQALSCLDKPHVFVRRSQPGHM